MTVGYTSALGHTNSKRGGDTPLSGPKQGMVLGGLDCKAG